MASVQKIRHSEKYENVTFNKDIYIKNVDEVSFIGCTFHSHIKIKIRNYKKFTMLNSKIIKKHPECGLYLSLRSLDNKDFIVPTVYIANENETLDMTYSKFYFSGCSDPKKIVVYTLNTAFSNVNFDNSTFRNWNGKDGINLNNYNFAKSQFPATFNYVDMKNAYLIGCYFGYLGNVIAANQFNIENAKLVSGNQLTQPNEIPFPIFQGIPCYSKDNTVYEKMKVNGIYTFYNENLENPYVKKQLIKVSNGYTFINV
jgi:hypothetical protein